MKSDTIMSRKTDFLLADSNEELNRRKMTAIRQCLKILEEDFTEPNQINSDLCPMSKVLHDDVEDEDTDVIGFSSTEDSKTVEEIDGALYVAICNLSHLHDADEVICNLKLSVDTEVSRVNSLKEEISPRLDYANLAPNKYFPKYSEDNGQRTLTLDDKEEVLSCDIQSSVGNMSLALSRESKIKALANKLGVHKEVKNTQDQKTLPMLCQQSIPALPKSPSSPDVIIEEIFEDDLEKQTEFPTECHADEQRKKLLNKETPFQHKAGSAELVFVSHVINPCHFYIRRYSQMKEAGVLEKKLKKLCCSKSSYLLSSDVLELAITGFIPIDNRYIPAERPEPATLQTIETDDFSLFVRKPNQHIEAELAAVPPLAVRCSLKDVVPKNARDNLDSLDLPKKIQEEYKHEDEKNLKIVCPVEGQACIAKQSDGNWYRAQIIGLPSHEEVMVKYVDFGNIGNVTLKDIRRVKKEFLSFPEKAFRCRLAFIEPYKGESEWNRKAKERFEEITKDKLMLCLVVEILDNNILSVELFDSSAVHARSFSINLQLVKEDLASSYIRGSTENTAVRPNEIWDVPLVGIPETSEALNSSDMESVDEGDFKSLCKKELQVRISHVVSPSKIFIQWLSSESVLKRPTGGSTQWTATVCECLSYYLTGAEVKMIIQVQYIDHGCIEKIPQCHLYPTTLYTGIPPFCIPCQLYKTVPVSSGKFEDILVGFLLFTKQMGNFWQQDAVNCLQELLTNEEVEIHVQELPDNPWGKLSINLYCGGMSLSSFMAYQKYCVVEDGQDISELELIEGDVSDLPSYTLPPLPDPGDTFPVRVTHLVSPKEVYICFEPSESPLPPSAPEGDASCDSELESLEEALKWCNKCVESFPLVTHFQTDMPCLVEYQDGFWYRAKLLSVEEFDPVKILVQFVDYGNFSVVPASRLRHVPYHLLKYPVQAVRALLAGFKPALYDEDEKRIPYSPEWSVEALWAMMECVEGKQLSASILAVSPEVTISLYGDDQNLVHMKLIEMGLADLDE
ncbi:Rnf17 [Columba guinea]|nr:Rnf17 [Columba guinea]